MRAFRLQILDELLVRGRGDERLFVQNPQEAPVAVQVPVAFHASSLKEVGGLVKLLCHCGIIAIVIIIRNFLLFSRTF